MEETDQPKPLESKVVVEAMLPPETEGESPLFSHFREAAEEAREEREWQQIWHNFHVQMAEKPEVQTLVGELKDDFEFMIQTLNPRNMDFRVNSHMLGQINQMLGSNRGISVLAKISRIRTAHTLKRQNGDQAKGGVMDNPRATITRILRKTIEFFEQTPRVDKQAFDRFYSETLKEEEVTHSELESIFGIYIQTIRKFMRKYEKLCAKECEASMPKELQDFIAGYRLINDPGALSRLPAWLEIAQRILNTI